MSSGMLRDFLALAEDHGRLRRVPQAVDRLWEPGCLVQWVFHGLPMEQRFGLRSTRPRG